jgi:hypothetical protein
MAKMACNHTISLKLKVINQAKPSKSHSYKLNFTRNLDLQDSLVMIRRGTSK